MVAEESPRERERIEKDAAVWGLKEAAAYLHVSYSTVLRMVNSGELPAWQIKGCWRTSDVLCRRYVEEQVKKQALICRASYSE